MIELSWTTRAVPIVQVGIGASAVETGADARWDISEWGSPTAVWSGDQPMWRDITEHTHWVEPVLGRKRATDRFEPARMAVVVSNESGWADPVPLDDPDTLTLRAGRPIRWGVVHEEFGTIWKFRGYIDSVTPRYDPVHSAVVDIVAVCALGEAGRGTVPKVAVAVGANELGHTRIGRLANAVKWPTLMRDFEATSVTMLATELGKQAADLMAETVDSLGGALFGDTEGRLALRNRDWQLYDPAVPVDGRIGQGSTLITEAHIDFPSTTGNYATVPHGVATPADAALDLRVEALHPTAPFANGQAYSAAASGPAHLYFHTSGQVNAYLALLPGGALVVSVAAVTLAGQGYPGAGNWVQWRWVWEPVADTLTSYWRVAGSDLLDDTGWTQAATATHAGNAVNTAVTTWTLTGTTASSFAMDGKVARWVRKVNGALVVDVNAATDITDPAAATFTATTGQTVTVARSSRVDHVAFPGATGNYMSIPDAAAVDFAGDFTIIANLSDVAAAQEILLNKSSALAFGTVAYALRAEADGRWTLFVENSSGALSSPQTSVGDFDLTSRPWIRVDLDANDGTGKFVVTWYDSPDGTTWTLRRTNNAGAGVTAVPRVTTDPVEIGGRAAGTQMFAGTVHHLELRNGIGVGGAVGGTQVFRFDRDSTMTTAASSTIASGTGQTITVFRSGGSQTTATLEVPGDTVELVPAEIELDVWASRWTFSNARRDIVTRAVLGRTTDDEPFTYDDDIGQSLYGIEDYTATDLICTAEEQLDRLADRVLRTRGWETAERVETVRIDASTSDRALDLVTLLDPFAPSRYRCELVTDNGTVFDREMFATGVRHRMTRDEWIVEINLDVAEPWAISGGRWGFAYWDESEWSPTG